MKIFKASTANLISNNKEGRRQRIPLTKTTGGGKEANWFSIKNNENQLFEMILHIRLINISWKPNFLNTWTRKIHETLSKALAIFNLMTMLETLTFLPISS